MLGSCQFKLLAPKTPGERKERGLLPLPPLLSLPYAEIKKRRRGWKSAKNTSVMFENTFRLLDR